MRSGILKQHIHIQMPVLSQGLWQLYGFKLYAPQDNSKAGGLGETHAQVTTPLALCARLQIVQG